MTSFSSFVYDEEDDDEFFELPPGGPAASIASEEPLLPNVPVLDLDAFLLGVDVPAQLLPDGPALNLDPELGLGATDDRRRPLRHRQRENRQYRSPARGSQMVGPAP